MEKKFQEYKLEDFLDDPDFCSWARLEQPEMDDYYQQLLAKFPGQKETFQKAYRLVKLFDDEKIKTSLSRKVQIWERVGKIYRNQHKPSKNYKLLFRYAATIALLVTVGSFSYYFISTSSEKNFVSAYSRQDYTKTRLVLDDGREIDINDDRSEIIYGQDNGQVKVNDELVQHGKTTKSASTNQLIVPFGKQSKIVLADQTEVWLNAGSCLVYPTVFDGDKRKVQLQGEAFFHVSIDKSKPFIVETYNSSIRVLGTSFNVKSYPDEATEETVLVEGSISLNLGKRILGKDIFLKPEQRLVSERADNTYTISNVNVNDYTSWIEGIFVFNDEPLTQVGMRISRFYNLEIKWLNDAENRKISGKLDLKDDYQRVLDALALISNGSYIEKDEVIYFRLKK